MNSFFKNQEIRSDLVLAIKLMFVYLMLISTKQNVTLTKYIRNLTNMVIVIINNKV